MNATTLRHLAATAPQGTTGIAVAPWGEDEVYAVAANWGDAASPVYCYGGDWQPTGRQVADYSHSPEAALEEQLAAALVASGDRPDEAGALVGDAVGF